MGPAVTRGIKRADRDLRSAITQLVGTLFVDPIESLVCQTVDVFVFTEELAILLVLLSRHGALDSIALAREARATSAAKLTLNA